VTRIVFLGSPAEALPALHAAHRTFEVALVVTRPDRPRGRSRRIGPGPVRQAADTLGLPVAQPDDADDLYRCLREAEPFDAGLVVAFGMILRPDVLRLAPHGFLNLHFSILPRWRGAAPVVHALLAGDRRTGVSLMSIDEGLDTGPVGAVASVAVAPDDDAGTLTARLAQLGGRLVGEVVPAVLRGEVVFVRQPEAGATLAPKVAAADARLDLTQDADLLVRRVRAFAPRPGAFVVVAGKRLKVLRASARPGSTEPGILDLADDGVPVLGTGRGLLHLERIQPEGKRPMSGAAWARGVRDLPARVDASGETPGIR